jgi:deoxyribonuclease V
MAVLPVLSHPWRLTLPDARALQQRLAGQVIDEDRLGPVRWVAGADIAYAKDSDTLHAAAVVLDARTLEVVETSAVRREAAFPYVPGFLSFRELPPLLEAFARLARRPDLVLCDGQGRAHPRRFGLACHLGVLLDLPAIGCGKSRLLGAHREPGRTRGCGCRLVDGGEVIGRVLRTRTDVRPVYISVGHRVSLATACRWVLRLARSYRLPEPVRAADGTVNRLRAADTRA